MANKETIASANEPILVTGAAGFIGPHVVGNLLNRGFLHIRCLARPSANLDRLAETIDFYQGKERVEIIKGNLLSRADCSSLAKDVVLIYHLAAGAGTKAFSDAFLNSVVTTRNLLDATLKHQSLRRFVNVSSFSVYTNSNKPKRGILDETCPVERDPGSRAEAYCYGKVKQDELVIEYGRKNDLAYVIVRPGTVYGPGKNFIPGRVGIDSFGLFLHFGGANLIPFTYVDNCADAIVMCGLKPGINGEVFNVVDDDLPSSRRFLRLYKKICGSFKSLYVPHVFSYLFCFLWEKYSKWSRGQLPPVFTRKEWAAFWKKTRYSNRKLKDLVGWEPRVTTAEGLKRFFEMSQKESEGRNAGPYL